VPPWIAQLTRTHESSVEVKFTELLQSHTCCYASYVYFCKIYVFLPEVYRGSRKDRKAAQRRVAQKVGGIRSTALWLVPATGEGGSPVNASRLDQMDVRAVRQEADEGNRS
jgi:hypothetical protein